MNEVMVNQELSQGLTIPLPALESFHDKAILTSTRGIQAKPYTKALSFGPPRRKTRLNVW